MSKPKYLLILSGPTASGKTGLSLQLAKHFDTVILSADSRQFYREMSIGTAKPNTEELEQAPHYFINSKSITDDYSVGDFEREAMEVLEKCFQEKDIVLLVGGSGLYIQAVVEGLDNFPEVPKSVRESLNQIYQEEGIKALQEELQVADPKYYEEVDLQNPQRLIRALEVCRVAQKPFSHFRKAGKSSRPFQAIYLQMQWPRPILYTRINQRVDQMMEAGLLEEVKTLLPYKKHNALQTVGYQEFFPYLAGEGNLQEAVELLKRNTRRYAKRQMTWNRRTGHWKHFHPANVQSVIQYLAWVLATGQQLLWKKEPDTEISYLGIQSKETWTGYLKVSSKKKNISVVPYDKQAPSLETPLYYFLVQEVVLKNKDREIFAGLAEEWHPTLEQLGFKKAARIGWFLALEDNQKDWWA